MRMKFVGALFAGIVAVLAADTEVAAQSVQELAVKERQEIMKGLFPKYLGPISRVARGESTDVAAIPDLAQKAKADLQKVAALFPPNSMREQVKETRAKPEVWSERVEFDAAIAKLNGELDKMADAAKGGKVEDVRAQFSALGQACGGCHGGPDKSGGKFRFEAE